MSVMPEQHLMIEAEPLVVEEDALVFDVRTLGEPEVDEIAVRVRELAEED